MQGCCLYLLIGSFFRQTQLLCHSNSFCHSWQLGSSWHKGMACAAGLGRDLGGMCLQLDDMHLAYQGVKCCPACSKQALIRSFPHALQLAGFDSIGFRPGYVASKGERWVGLGRGGIEAWGPVELVARVAGAAGSDCSHTTCSLTPYTALEDKACRQATQHWRCTWSV